MKCVGENPPNPVGTLWRKTVKEKPKEKPMKNFLTLRELRRKTDEDFENESRTKTM